MCRHAAVVVLAARCLRSHSAWLSHRRQAATGALQAWPGGLQLGGGVNLDNAKQWLDAGASHVIVTSFVFREGRLEEDRLKALVSGPGCGTL